MSWLPRLHRMGTTRGEAPRAMAGQASEAGTPICPPTHMLPNVRDLGGYETPSGPTVAHRFLRSGNTSSVTNADIAVLAEWNVTRVLDLRGKAESPAQTCRLSRQAGIVWRNVSLYDIDITGEAKMPVPDSGNYLVPSYRSMLASAGALRQVFCFLGEAGPSECVLFHCAAGMDRTGMLSMLLLGLAGVGKEDVCRDYCYSFAQPAIVDKAVRDAMERGVPVVDDRSQNFASYLLTVRLEAIWCVWDMIVASHGTVREFLLASGIEPDTLDGVRDHLLRP